MFWQLTELLRTLSVKLPALCAAINIQIAQWIRLLPINRDPCIVCIPLVNLNPLSHWSFLCRSFTYSHLTWMDKIVGGNIRVLRSPVKSQAVRHLEALARKAVMFNDTHALSLSSWLLMRCSSLCMDESASGGMLWLKCLSPLWPESLRKVQH